MEIHNRVSQVTEKMYMAKAVDDLLSPSPITAPVFETYTKQEDIGGIVVTKTYTKASNLHNWADNPREIKVEMFDYLIKSLHAEGQLMPMLVDVRPGKMGDILGGNMTFRAWTQNLGHDEVWIEPRLPRDDNHAVEIALKHNANYGQYIELKLQELAQSLKDAGYDLSEIPIPSAPETNLSELLQKISPPEVIEDTPPEVSAEPAISQLGEVYQLGRHRLMCGDATSIEAVEKLMNSQKADMIFTDPPYNVSYEGKTKEALTIQNDTQTSGDFYQFLLDAFVSMATVAKSGAVFYICHADLERVNFTKAFQDAGIKLAEVIIWAKQHFVMGRQDYQWKHEPILYGWKEGEGHFFIGDRNQTTIWEVDRPMASLEHPTMKPLGLIVKAINNSSKGEDIILDTFGGSGSTLIAAEQTNRTCYTMELDPKYCDVIRKRYAKFLGREEEWQTLTPTTA